MLKYLLFIIYLIFSRVRTYYKIYTLLSVHISNLVSREHAVLPGNRRFGTWANPV